MYTMPLDLGRVTHLLEQMHRSEDNAGVAIPVDKVLVTDGAAGFTWEDYGAGATVHNDLTGRDQADNHSTYLLNLAGEAHVQAVIPDAGAAETLNLSTANVFAIGLSTGCTLTLTPPTDDGTARVWTLVFSGEFAVTWPGSVVWMDGDGTAPDAAETLAVELVTLDGGTTYLASAGRGSGSLVAALDDLTDVTITSVAADDVLRYNGSVWVNTQVSAVGHYELLMTGSSPPEPLEDGTGTDWLYVWTTG